MIDLILYTILGFVVVGLSVWGGIVSAKSLPAGENRSFHIGGFIALGLAAAVLTALTGILNYQAQQGAIAEQKALKASLVTDGKLLSETKANLDQSRVDEATMKGQLQMVGPLLATIHGDQTTAFSTIGAALIQSAQAYRPTGNRYELLPTADLKKEALDVVRDLRDLADKTDAEEENFNNSLTSRPFSQQAWNAQVQKEMEFDSQFTQAYESGYKVEAKLLRDELMRREAAVPDAKTMSQLNFTYDHPTNPLGLRKVADNLETLAKSLPDGHIKRYRQ